MELLIVMLLFGSFSASTMFVNRVKTGLFKGSRRTCQKCKLTLDPGRSICPVCGTYLSRPGH
ncbi:MAG: hypothetical protein J0I20_09245 [Chloroflexi bacterium]|nr:hypothetical protein [Chloroflexota bacterium]OJV94702.1 MAG: hypothetical protein BGO39_23570 [Chloroflexi bacterium 54-19]